MDGHCSITKAQLVYGTPSPQTAHRTEQSIGGTLSRRGTLESRLGRRAYYLFSQGGGVAELASRIASFLTLEKVSSTGSTSVCVASFTCSTGVST